MASWPPKYILQLINRFSVKTSKMCLALVWDPEYTTFLKDLWLIEQLPVLGQFREILRFNKKIGNNFISKNFLSLWFKIWTEKMIVIRWFDKCSTSRYQTWNQMDHWVEDWFTEMREYHCDSDGFRYNFYYLYANSHTPSSDSLNVYTLRASIPYCSKRGA